MLNSPGTEQCLLEAPYPFLPTLHLHLPSKTNFFLPSSKSPIPVSLTPNGPPQRAISESLLHCPSPLTFAKRPRQSQKAPFINPSKGPSPVMSLLTRPRGRHAPRRVRPRSFSGSVIPRVPRHPSHPPRVSHTHSSASNRISSPSKAPRSPPSPLPTWPQLREDLCRRHCVCHHPVVSADRSSRCPAPQLPAKPKSAGIRLSAPRCRLTIGWQASLYEDDWL